MPSIVSQELQDTRSRILQFLKLGGPMTADELSQELGITYMGVRQHLINLEHDGLIQHHAEQRGPGRPSYVYSLTNLGDEFFPRKYPQLASGLLDAVRTLDGEDGLERIFEERTVRLEVKYRARLTGKDLLGQVRELAQICTEEGYMTNWEKYDHDTFVLQEHNCAVRQVAECCGLVCRYELELFRRLLNEAEVVSDQHIMQGALICSYLIRREK